MAKFDVKHVCDVKAHLGEGPAWSVEEQALYWVDVYKSQFNRFDPASGKNRVWEMPSMPGCFALRAGKGAVIAARDGYYDFDFTTGKLDKLADVPFDSTIFRFNDGKPDRQGRLWAGIQPHDLTPESEKGQGTYYRFDGKSVVAGFGGVTVPNGTAFSPDGKTMYRDETFDRMIYAYDYDPATGTPSNQRVFAPIPDGFGMPDGATVDTEGGYWVALPAGPAHGSIARFTPDGKLDLTFDMPILLPSMPVFGGPKMSTLYITSIGDPSFKDWFEAPMGEYAGDLFAVETPFTGIPETNFPLSR